MNEKNWTFLGPRGACGTSETMTISAASLTVISIHARAGYMAHIKRSLFPGFRWCPLQHTMEIEFQAKKKQRQQQAVKISTQPPLTYRLPFED